MKKIETSILAGEVLTLLEILPSPPDIHFLKNFLGRSHTELGIALLKLVSEGMIQLEDIKVGTKYCVCAVKTHNADERYADQDGLPHSRLARNRLVPNLN
ncbi:MAG: hypothetical protein KC897_00685 [Candidatus Omnitrophica bacterium]|nr:hypothetical protein [Candidatus Omnitrophota bacterium]MCB9719967.1 hypothetical protein [Candidatus Omnitrophota bacterium]